MNNHVFSEIPSLDVEWKDLVAYARWETCKELFLPIPWLIAAWLLGMQHFWGGMAFCCAFVFMLGVRIAHNSFHRTLGLSSMAGHMVMWTLSLLMIGSLHAIQYTHLLHHDDCMGSDDVEGHIAHLGFWEGLFKSPIYPLWIHIVALRDSSSTQRALIVIELFSSAALQTLIWTQFDSEILKAFSLYMLLANAIAPIVGIWLVHHACEHPFLKARSNRIVWLNRLTFGMLYHLEHHLYPAVPTCHLPILVKRLTKAKFKGFKTVF
jgi:fatty acid desaturase